MSLIMKWWIAILNVAALVIIMVAVATLPNEPKELPEPEPITWIHEETGCHYFLVGQYNVPMMITDAHGAPFCPDVGDGFFEGKDGEFDLTPEGEKMFKTAEGIFEVGMMP